MDFFRHTFNEDSWNIFLVDDDDEVIADENAAATTKFNDKELYFRRSHINLRLVLHELFHVYFSYCYLESTTDLSLGDMEEIAATLFEYKAESIIATAKIILEKLEQLKLTSDKE